ncbi:protein of unknown function DUF167 [Syntrophotalea carbinolica DSM 2380]|uniref:UPF0235 protein Pcar_0617 n=1 Tax=Syntrophotalea carbinolica (strain DSM 2380 / NBRC 103641 / GraBd1) TaxID=338963 RepID=Y617_SYNC1|nr:DUF167 domain-containing protein [Syntrophotalea carbinolica]Q3A6Y1.1 RecName: Full=UPF0235 protein Pcar_0617 [Syntrophotalea carbinolica DSM 2380]ABA87876.1 protein of unknown function DUF167 [Syntrophotalea carbinolica DSM 2380]
MAECLSQTDKGVVLSVHVQPRASRNELAGLQGESLKIRLTSPPVEGAANKLCREFLAKLLGVAKSRVTLVSGDKSRHKRLLIEGVTLDEVRNKLL